MAAIYDDLVASKDLARFFLPLSKALAGTIATAWAAGVRRLYLGRAARVRFSLLGLALQLAACRPGGAPVPAQHPPAPPSASRAEGAPIGTPRALSGIALPPRPARAPRHDPDALPAAGPEVPSERRALQVSDGVERLVDADEARRRGLTVVDLSDGWAPVIFADGTGPAGEPLANAYRRVFVGLANDQTDADGQPLGAPSPFDLGKNFLELLGIPPSLSVLGARISADAARDCRAVDPAKLLAVNEIPTWGASTEERELGRAEARARRLRAALGQAAGSSAGTGARSGQAAPPITPARDLLARDLEAHRRFEAERAAFGEVEKRMVCEGLLAARGSHRAGRYDTVLRAAVLAFQQKHAVMAQGDLTRATLQAMARAPVELDFAALRRTLAERAVHSASILEDGSAIGEDGQAATYLGQDGQRHPVPDLVASATEALMVALDLENPGDAVDFFRRHGPDDFRSLRAVARFPALPEYHAAGRDLELSAEIDRGDVWYDFPFDARGIRLPQPREHFPTFTLFVRWRGERVPLVRWRTTVGGWRSEVASDAQEYYAYKGSDVGPRVWRHLVAAPVWIPPPTAPLGGMIKEKRVNGAFVKVTNYDEVGPGSLSAYGLVAAIHEQMRVGPGGGVSFADNGIRTHGSFDYLSLRGRFSHGCHRLYNNMAVRLFSFVLSHHRARTIGTLPLDYRRTFFAGGELFDLRLPARGFYYELEPPIPIETRAGTIRGVRQTPVTGYVRKPGIHYRAVASATVPAMSDSPDSKASGGGEP
jgi:hypothetical protein